MRALLLALMPLSAASAWEPPEMPILRIDPGMHTAPIRRIGVDDQGRFLVTAGKDGTARP